MPRSGIIRTALVGSALAAGLFLAAPANAQEGGLIQGVLGAVGLVPAERAPIDYRDRAPLVVPPRLDALPPPAAPGAATNAAAWPVDPEIAAMQRENPDQARYRPDGRMTVEEIRAGRREGAGLVANPDNAPLSRSYWLDPRELRAIDTRRAEEAQLRGPMQRRFLTDPPQGLLLPDESAGRVRDTDAGRSNEAPSVLDFIREQRGRN